MSRSATKTAWLWDVRSGRDGLRAHRAPRRQQRDDAGRFAPSAEDTP